MQKYAPYSLVMALSIGAVGSILALIINMPLAFLLGPLFACMVAGLCGIPVNIKERVRGPVMVILGTFLASRFTPDILVNLNSWPLSIIALVPFIGVSTISAGWYLRRFAKLDPATATFSAVPGGLAMMIAMGHEAGGNQTQIALVHSLRIVFSVFLIAFGLTGVLDTDRNQMDMIFANLSPNIIELGIVLCIGAGSAWLGHKLSLPAAYLFAPMLVVGPLYAFGFVSVAIPGPILAAALWVMGSSVGSRFYGYSFRSVLHLSGHSFVSVVLLLLLTGGSALVIHTFLDIPFWAAVLAFAPGGLTEMSLIALAMDLDPAYVALHHLMRVAICIAALPWLRHLSAPSELE